MALAYFLCFYLFPKYNAALAYLGFLIIYTYIDKDNNRKLVFTGITDENGNIKIEDIFVGKYVIIETDADKG